MLLFLRSFVVTRGGCAGKPSEIGGIRRLAGDARPRGVSLSSADRVAFRKHPFAKESSEIQLIPFVDFLIDFQDDFS